MNRLYAVIAEERDENGNLLRSEEYERHDCSAATVAARVRALNKMIYDDYRSKTHRFRYQRVSPA